MSSANPDLVFLGRLIIVLAFGAGIWWLMLQHIVSSEAGLTALTATIFAAAMRPIDGPAPSVPAPHTPHVDVPEVPPDTSGTATTTWRAAEKDG